MPGFNIGPFADGCSPPNVPFGASSIVSNTLETARKNRFVVTATPPVGHGFDFDQSELNPSALALCESIDRPIPRITKERVWNGADYINVPLRVEFDPIQLVLYEMTKDVPAGIFGARAFKNFGASAVLDWWTKGAFDYANSRMSFPEARRVTVNIFSLNGAGDVIWGYRLSNCWPEIVSPDPHEYKDSDIAKVRLTLQFDKVVEANDLILRDLLLVDEF